MNKASLGKKKEKKKKLRMKNREVETENPDEIGWNERVKLTTWNEGRVIYFRLW